VKYSSEHGLLLPIQDSIIDQFFYLFKNNFSKNSNKSSIKYIFAALLILLFIKK